MLHSSGARGILVQCACLKSNLDEVLHEDYCNLDPRLLNENWSSGSSQALYQELAQYPYVGDYHDLEEID